MRLKILALVLYNEAENISSFVLQIRSKNGSSCQFTIQEPILPNLIFIRFQIFAVNLACLQQTKKYFIHEMVKLSKKKPIILFVHEEKVCQFTI